MRFYVQREKPEETEEELDQMISEVVENPESYRRFVASNCLKCDKCSPRVLVREALALEPVTMETMCKYYPEVEK